MGLRHSKSRARQGIQSLRCPTSSCMPRCPRGRTPPGTHGANGTLSPLTSAVYTGTPPARGLRPAARRHPVVGESATEAEPGPTTYVPVCDSIATLVRAVGKSGGFSPGRRRDAVRAGANGAMATRDSSGLPVVSDRGPSGHMLRLHRSVSSKIFRKMPLYSSSNFTLRRSMTT